MEEDEDELSLENEDVQVPEIFEYFEDSAPVDENTPEMELLSTDSDTALVEAVGDHEIFGFQKANSESNTRVKDHDLNTWCKHPLGVSLHRLKSDLPVLPVNKCPGTKMPNLCDSFEDSTAVQHFDEKDNLDICNPTDEVVINEIAVGIKKNSFETDDLKNQIGFEELDYDENLEKSLEPKFCDSDVCTVIENEQKEFCSEFCCKKDDETGTQNDSGDSVVDNFSEDTDDIKVITEQTDANDIKTSQDNTEAKVNTGNADEERVKATTCDNIDDLRSTNSAENTKNVGECLTYHTSSSDSLHANERRDISKSNELESDQLSVENHLDVHKVILVESSLSSVLKDNEIFNALNGKDTQDEPDGESVNVDKDLKLKAHQKSPCQENSVSSVTQTDKYPDVSLLQHKSNDLSVVASCSFQDGRNKRKMFTSNFQFDSSSADMKFDVTVQSCVEEADHQTELGSAEESEQSVIRNRKNIPVSSRTAHSSRNISVEEHQVTFYDMFQSSFPFLLDILFWICFGICLIVYRNWLGCPYQVSENELSIPTDTVDHPEQ